MLDKQVTAYANVPLTPNPSILALKSSALSFREDDNACVAFICALYKILLLSSCSSNFQITGTTHSRNRKTLGQNLKC